MKKEIAKIVMKLYGVNVITAHQRTEMKELKQKAKEFTDYLYDAYGSGTGILFGIPSYCKDGVYAIVKLVMEKFEKQNNIIKELNTQIGICIKANKNLDKELQEKEARIDYEIKQFELLSQNSIPKEKVLSELNRIESIKELAHDTAKLKIISQIEILKILLNENGTTKNISGQ